MIFTFSNSRHFASNAIRSLFNIITWISVFKHSSSRATRKWDLGHVKAAKQRPESPMGPKKYISQKTLCMTVGTQQRLDGSHLLNMNADDRDIIVKIF